MFVLVSFSVLASSRAQEDLIYWVDESEQSLMRGRIDGTRAEIVVKHRMPAALEVFDGWIYWIDSSAGAILRQAIDEASVDTLLAGRQFNLTARTDVAIDPASQSMFWTQPCIDDDDACIYRAGLNGADPHVVVDSLSPMSTHVLEADPQSGFLFWLEKVPDRSSEYQIARARMDGSERIAFSHKSGWSSEIEVDPDEGAVYWLEGHRVMRSALDGSGVERAPMQGLSSVHALEIDPERRLLYVASNQTLFRAGLDSIGFEIIAEIHRGAGIDQRVSNLSLDLASGRLLWINDGSPTRIVSLTEGDSTFQEVEHGFFAPISAAVDAERGKLFWLDSVGNLYGADSKGRHVSRITYAGCGTDIELDLPNDWIYWSGENSCSWPVNHVSMDGASPEPLSTSSRESAHSIAIASEARLAFWSEGPSSAGIHRMTFDGSGLRRVLNEIACGIDVYPDAGELYWANCSDRIQRSGIEGGSVEDLVNGLDGVADIEIDESGGRLYWSETGAGRIRSIALDGTGARDVFTGLPSPGRIALAMGLHEPVRAEEAHPLAEQITLDQNFPNPFRSATTIRFALPEAENVRVTVYDLLGRVVGRLTEGTRSPGVHELKFDADGLPSGVYLYQLEAGSYRVQRRLVLVR